MKRNERVWVPSASIAVLAMGVLGLGLAGCTSQEPAITTSSPSASASSSSPTNDPGSPTPTDATPSTTPQGSGIADSGSKQGAEGNPVLDDSGAITAYIVARNDLGYRIAERFGTTADNIYNEDGQAVSHAPIIQEGQILTFKRAP